MVCLYEIYRLKWLKYIPVVSFIDNLVAVKIAILPEQALLT
jgi:hypothetical protein